jgi:hypothetical protein
VPYSQHIIFFITYEWAKYAKILTLHWAGNACQGQNFPLAYWAHL